MKKRGHHDNKGGKHRQIESNSADNKKDDKKEEQNEIIRFNDDTHNQGFSEWLRSSDGMEMMRLFVIANSILVFMTMAWPRMQEVIVAIKYYINDEVE